MCMNVTFFIGAGTSVIAGLPTTVELLRELKSSHSNDSVKLLESYPNSDIEHLLHDIEEFSHYENSLLNSILASYANRNLDAIKKNMDEIRKEIRHILFRLFKVNDDNIKKYRSAFQHIVKLQQQSHIHIVTTNYDMLIEETCHKEGIAITDGFSFQAGGLRARWTNDWRYESGSVELVKLHGSLNWRQRPDGIDRESNDFMPSEDQDLLIAPTLGNKNYNKSTIFSALFEQFKRILDNTDVLVAIGTSWRDKEIVEEVKKRESNAEMKILTIGPAANSTSKVFGQTTSLQFVDGKIEREKMVPATYIYTLNEPFGMDVAKAIPHAINLMLNISS